MSAGDWINLQTAVFPGNRHIFEAAERLGSAADVLAADERELRLLGILSSREIERIINADPTVAERILRRCEQASVAVVTPEDSRYPNRLRTIPAQPLVLYVKGTLPDMDREAAVAVVGTRNATRYGHQVAYDLSLQLAEHGALIVSGAALGIDSDAHRGALSACGRTVAVLGCGIEFPYLRENEELRRAIVRNGALISEYPPDTPATPYSFPARNRILSGLALGTVVIEAGVKSGSLITAAHASEQGRDVFAVPGNVTEPTFQGTNKLLREGAKPVFSVRDVLEEYAERFPYKISLPEDDRALGTVILPRAAAAPAPAKKHPGDAGHRPVKPTAAKPAITEPTGISTAEKAIQKAVSVPNPPVGLSSKAERVYNAFTPSAEASLDELVAATGLIPAEALAALTELEIFGVVSGTAGSRYRIND